ncbi:MAG: hypothetical protein A2Y10_04140 [Planctomycetes bacterium GWF2_41_51]|nr:MAG: hypothetical protein A2Y10_04140 [Planctomycetes bacterium GWF2_41_51]
MQNLSTNDEIRKWSKASLTELIDHLEQVHQIIKSEKNPHLQQLLDEILNTYTGKHREMLESLQEFFTIFKSEAEDHIKREEEILFSYIRKLEFYKTNDGTKPAIPFHSIENPISQIELDHVKLENTLLEAIDKIASVFKTLEESSDSFKIFYEDMKSLQSEIMEHMRLETNVVFPEAIRLELSVMYEK